MSIFSDSGHWLDDTDLEPTEAELLAIEAEAIDDALSTPRVYRSCRVPARRRRRRWVRRVLVMGGAS